MTTTSKGDRHPSKFAWMMLYITGAALPIIAIVALVLASNGLLGSVYTTLVSHGVLLLIGLATFLTTVGLAVYQKHAFEVLSWVWAMMIGTAIIVVIGVTLRAFFVHSPPPPQVIPYWLLAHIGVLLGVLLYCSSLMDRVTNEVRNHYSSIETVVAVERLRVDELERQRNDAQDAAARATQRIEDELSELGKQVNAARRASAPPRQRRAKQTRTK